MVPEVPLDLVFTKIKRREDPKQRTLGLGFPLMLCAASGPTGCIEKQLDPGLSVLRPPPSSKPGIRL